jgi:LmbE family N-acetylglucosaminyl deacetylase
MQPLIFDTDKEKDLSVLCIGAHCDDIEIGCGGTLFKLIENTGCIRVKWVVFASNEVRKKEARNSAERFLEGADEREIEIFSFEDGYLPTVWNEIKKKFEVIKKQIKPDLIFTHYRHDLHQDHRMLNELTWNTFRNHLILEYEILKYDGDLGTPNFFVSINKELLDKKMKILMECFESQLHKQWFDETLLTSLPRIRGVECATKTKFAEAFYCRKMILE